MSEDGGTEQNNTYVWGTNLVIADIQTRIRRFMRSFTQEGSSDALYTTLIKQASSCVAHSHCMLLYTRTLVDMTDARTKLAVLPQLCRL